MGIPDGKEAENPPKALGGADLVATMELRLVEMQVQACAKTLKISDFEEISNSCGTFMIHSCAGSISKHDETATVPIRCRKRLLGEAQALNAGNPPASGEIMRKYAGRRQIEVFFRHSKVDLCIDKIMLRKGEAIYSCWSISFLFFDLRRRGLGGQMGFSDGKRKLQAAVRDADEKYFYGAKENGTTLDEAKKLFHRHDNRDCEKGTPRSRQS
jgi:hypothetical protein